jgi:hypothetical protein
MQEYITQPAPIVTWNAFRHKDGKLISDIQKTPVLEFIAMVALEVDATGKSATWDRVRSFIGRSQRRGIVMGGTGAPRKPNCHPALRVAAASHALAGRFADTQKAVVHLDGIDPAFRASNLKDYIPLRSPEDLAGYGEGLRKAGVPE